MPPGRDQRPGRFGLPGPNRSGLGPPSSACLAGVWLPRLVIVALALLALSAAVSMFLAHAAAPERLWADVHHDRNGHFGFGLDLALALRVGDVAAFLSQLAKAVVWPPVHGLLLAAVLAAGGPDDRLGIVPSLAGWTATVVLTAMLARRLFDDAPGGMSPAARMAAGAAGAVASAVAGALALASPAFRLLGSDVMLEALGAAWSALALLCFARAMDAPREAARWRLLGLALTLLFFHKGNYWGLVVASLLVAFAIERRAEVKALVRAVLSATRVPPPGALTGALARDPLRLAALAVVALIAVIYRHGPISLDLFGQAVSLYPPENLVTVAYALVFADAVVVWQRQRGRLAPVIGIGGHALLAWHVLPVAVSFLIPKRLSAFLWFVGPSNVPSGQPYDPLGAVVYYWTMAADGFYAGPVVAVLAVGLFGIGLAGIRRYPPGGRAVFVLALVAALGVIVHPHHQGRFLASWLFAWWVGAGAGAGLLVELWAVRRPPARTRLSAAMVSAGVLVAAVLAAAAARPPPSATALTAANRYPGPSDLSLLAPVLPALAGARSIGVAATVGRAPFFAWAIHVGCRCAVPIDGPWFVDRGSRSANRAAMEDFLAATAVDRLLVVDVPPGNPAVLEPGFVGLLDAMATQTRFVPLVSVAAVEHGATLTVWGRRDLAAPGGPQPSAAAASAKPSVAPAGRD